MIRRTFVIIKRTFFRLFRRKENTKVTSLLGKGKHCRVNLRGVCEEINVPLTDVDPVEELREAAVMSRL